MGEMYDLLLRSGEITLGFLKRSIPGLVAGVFLAEVLIEGGIIGRVSFIGRPFVRLSNLPEECALAFTTAFLNTRAANAMLVGFHREGKIDKREMYIASLMNSFPSIVRHWNSLLPVLVATLGSLGVVYFGILVCIGLIKTLIFAFVGKLTLKRHAGSTDASRGLKARVSVPKSSGSRQSRPPWRVVIRRAAVNTRKVSLPILRTMIIVTYLVSLAIAAGAFDRLIEAVRGHSHLLPFPPQEVSVAVTAMLSGVAAYTMGANLLYSGLISEGGLIRALLLGSVLSSVTFLRVLIPYYVGLYGPKDGTKIMLISVTVRSLIVLSIVALMGAFVDVTRTFVAG